MKKRIGFSSLLALFLSMSLYAGCGSDSGSEQVTGEKYWSKIDWKTADGGIYSDFKHEGLSPSCSNHPKSISADFEFFARKGAENNLVVYFQGGGACWHTNNCIDETTYSFELQYFENETLLDMISSGQAKNLGYSGIFDFTSDGNPFKNWSFVYIPYCTGDLFWGASDHGYGGNVIRHRGQVNFQLVLEWLKKNFTDAPGKVFVTGMSGGAYGAIFNFPHIRDAFPGSSFFMLGDAGNGVINADFKANGLPNWNAKLPVTDGFTEFAGKDPKDLEISELYYTIANHYSDTPFAQYTAAWDENQAYFYNVMEKIETPGTDGATWDNIIEGTVWCDWHTKMLSNRDAILVGIGAGTGTYHYFIAQGDLHTILMFNEFYSVVSAEVMLVDWIGAMIDGGAAFDDVMCTDTCGRPAEDCLAGCEP